MRALLILTLAIFSLSLGGVCAAFGCVRRRFERRQFRYGASGRAGSLVSIFGTNLASTSSAATSVPLSTSLGGVKVTFNNIAAPLNYVSGGQINAQMPFELTGSSTAQVVVTNSGAASAPQTVQVASIAPGIFPFGGQAVAYGNTDYSSRRRPARFPD